MRIASVGTALPPHFYDQHTILARLEGAWAERHYNLDRLRALHHNVLVGGRHLALPIEEYEKLRTFGATNAAWQRVALEVGERAIVAALESAGLERDRVAALYFVTVTGLAVPSLDARLVNRLGLSPRIKRVPIFGLGCVAGAAGVARCADYVRAYPKEVALLLSVELCSLTLQRGDLSIPNLIASGLFGDGAAAVVVAGAEVAPGGAEVAPGGAEVAPGGAEVAPGGDEVAPDGDGWGPVVVASRSAFYRDTEHVMGWEISENGFKVVLSADVPEMVTRHLRTDVDAFLAEHGLALGDIASFVCHPGGPKVLEAMAHTLDLDADALELTWQSLREVGNLSSTSVLLVLERTMRERRPPHGSYGLLLAMGPGFCSELVLLRW